MPISLSSTLPLLAAGYGILSVGFGFNEILRPLEAITFFAAAPPEKEVDRKLVRALSVALGVRNVFMGALLSSPLPSGKRMTLQTATHHRFVGTAIFLTLRFSPAKNSLLGWLLVAGSACAAADGLACAAIIGDGGLNHAYAVMPLALGAALLGNVA